ncbi:MAG: helix-turn-helix domain-containing protein, partial [Myxococcota bacterium]|nr:helix-turn-helix domain-containing protein [Myxococcota bacterium]
ELVNCAQYVASLSPGPAVTIADLPDGVVRRTDPPQSDGTLTPPRVRTDLPYRAAKRAWLDASEARYVGALVEANNGNVSRAARESGIDRRSIQRILRRLNRTN